MITEPWDSNKAHLSPAYGLGAAAAAPWAAACPARGRGGSSPCGVPMPSMGGSGGNGVLGGRGGSGSTGACLTAGKGGSGATGACLTGGKGGSGASSGTGA